VLGFWPTRSSCVQATASALLLGLRPRLPSAQSSSVSPRQPRPAGTPFLSDAVQAPLGPFCCGLRRRVFNIANLLLVAAIDVAGLAWPSHRHWPRAGGRLGLQLPRHPKANPLLLFGGVLLVVVAIVLDAAAYRKREPKPKPHHRGIVLSLVAGVLMGTFYPLVAAPYRYAGQPAPARMPLPLLRLRRASLHRAGKLLLMAKPLDGKPPVKGSATGPLRSLAPRGLLGGAVWCLGAVANFVAPEPISSARRLLFHRPGRHMVSACWGVLSGTVCWRAPLGQAVVALHVHFLCSGAVRRALAPLY